MIGDRYHGMPPPEHVEIKLAEELAREGDIVMVDGREALPHVGKAAEKSAAW